MRSKVISFRVPDNVYQEFDKKCRDEGVSHTVKLRKLVDSACHHTVEELDTEPKAQVKVINVDGEKVDKVIETNSKKTSWFPLDFSPLFGKGM